VYDKDRKSPLTIPLSIQFAELNPEKKCKS